MTRQALGIDIGARAIKTVQVARGLRGVHRVAACRVVDLPEGGSPADGLAAVFADGSFSRASWASALSAADVSFRSLALPFADERKVRQALAFEVEPLIPFPIEDLFVDCMISRQPEGCQVVAAAAAKSLVRERIESIAAGAGEDGILDVAAVPVASLLLDAGVLKGGEILLDVGAAETAAVFIGNGRIVRIRHYPFGGDAITRAAADVLGVSYAEAEKLKRDGNLGRAEEAACDICESFFLQLSQTLESLCWTGEWEGAVSRILLTGGGALHRPFVQLTADRFAIPVERLNLAMAVGIAVGDVPGGWQPLLMDGALALGLRAGRSVRGFNFARAAKEEGRGAGISRKTLVWASGLAVCALLLGVVDFALDYYLAALRLEKAKQVAAETFKRYAPGATRIVDPVQQLTAEVNQAKQLARGLTGAHSGVTLIGMLREISLLVPPSAPLLIDTFLYEGDTVIIKGETQNFDAVNAIKNGLEQSRLFMAVAISSSQLMKREGKVSFEMRMTIR